LLKVQIDKWGDWSFIVCRMNKPGLALAAIYTAVGWISFAIIIFLALGTPFPREYKLATQYKGGYDRQSVQSAAGKLSCNKTALKRCTRTNMHQKILLLLLLLLEHITLNKPFPDSTDVEASGFEVAGTQHW